MTSNKKQRSGRPTCNSITFLLPFESDSMVNTRLHVTVFLVRDICIYILVLSLSDFSFASCACCTGWKVLSALLATIARTDGFRGGGDETRWRGIFNSDGTRVGGVASRSSEQRVRKQLIGCSVFLVRVVIPCDRSDQPICFAIYNNVTVPTRCKSARSDEARLKASGSPSRFPSPFFNSSSLAFHLANFVFRSSRSPAHFIHCVKKSSAYVSLYNWTTRDSRDRIKL